MSKKEVIQEESLFKNIDLSNSRAENESYDDYKLRLKRNKRILKLYFTYGREVFKQAFPEGVTNTSIEQLMSVNEKDNVQ